MRTQLQALALAILATSPVFAQTPSDPPQITRQEVVKLAISGISDDVIIAKIDQDKPVFQLGAGDVEDLKKLGVSERVIQRMLATVPPPAPAPAVTTPPAAVKEDANAGVVNSSFMTLFVSINEKDKVFSVSKSQGTELKVGQSLSWKLEDGVWTIGIEGNPTIDTFTVASTEKPVKLTLNGANTDYVEVVTLIVEDRYGRLVSIIDSVGKLTEGQRRRDPRIRPPGQYIGMYGPKFVYLPYVSTNILLGAGVGAMLGHRSGHTAEGALIGAAAGLLLDHTPWVPLWRW